MTVISLKQAKLILKEKGLESRIIGDDNVVFKGIATLEDAGPDQAVILRAKAKLAKTQYFIDTLNSKKVAAVITTDELSSNVKDTPVLIVENPRLAFTYLLDNNDKAIIEDSATIYDCVTLGENISIGPNTIVGSCGLSINRHDEKLVNTTHIGGVVIHDNVIIGGNSVIVRAVMGNTVIGEYSILAHCVSIGHGCQIGKRVKIAPGAVISGSCKVGNDVWIGPNVSIKEGISIGRGSFIGIGSVVINDLPENIVAVGSPAKILKTSKRPW